MVSSAKLTKSEQIRRLFDAGMSVAEIANYMGIRYQFAYNVVSYHVKQRELEVRKYVAAGYAGDSGVRDERG